MFKRVRPVLPRQLFKTLHGKLNKNHKRITRAMLCLYRPWFTPAERKILCRRVEWLPQHRTRCRNRWYYASRLSWRIRVQGKETLHPH